MCLLDVSGTIMCIAHVCDRRMLGPTTISYSSRAAAMQIRTRSWVTAWGFAVLQQFCMASFRMFAELHWLCLRSRLQPLSAPLQDTSGCRSAVQKPSLATLQDTSGHRSAV